MLSRKATLVKLFCLPSKMKEYTPNEMELSVQERKQEITKLVSFLKIRINKPTLREHQSCRPNHQIHTLLAIHVQHPLLVSQLQIGGGIQVIFFLFPHRNILEAPHQSPQTTACSPEWHSHCRYADVMQHFSNPIIATNEKIIIWAVLSFEEYKWPWKSMERAHLNKLSITFQQ